MHAPIKYVEKGLAVTANGLWQVFSAAECDPPEPVLHAKWSEKPLLKSWQKTKPPLGWPRETDSLCPTCVREARQAILDGKQDVSVLLTEKVGEIKATDHRARRQDPDGQGLPAARPLRRRDGDRPGDVQAPRGGRSRAATSDAHNDEKLHNHGSSTIKHGRGSVLTVDLTNRCNMMCDPCFMDANQVGFVHELTLGGHQDDPRQRDHDQAAAPDVGAVLGRRADDFAVLPRRGRATPARSATTSVQAATNGIEFAKSPEFAARPPKAGLRYAYLQFDGIGNAANSHRRVGNLFDVKLRAIENSGRAGVDIILVITIVNGVNNEQVGRVVEFALDNPKKIAFLSFQPVSFTGRDEEITPERRQAQRYTLSHLAHDVKNQIGIGEPPRDWFPISFMVDVHRLGRSGPRAAIAIGAR